METGSYSRRNGISILIAVAVLAAAQAASAFSFGQTSDQFVPNPALGCNNTSCHSGGTTPTVSLTGPTSVLPDSTNIYTLTIDNPATQPKGGFNVAAPDGIFSTGGADSAHTQALANGITGALEITHLGPKAAVSGVTTFTFQWTAPSSFTSVTLTGWGNAVNFDHTNMGDAASSSILVVANSSAQPPTATPSPTPTLPPPMATATPSRTATRTATRTHTVTATKTATTVATATATVAPPTAITTPSSTATDTATQSPTPSATETATTLPTATDTPLVPTDTPSSMPSPTASPSDTPVSTLTPTPIPCSGDCNQDGIVTVDELMSAVNIALGNGASTDCSAADVNGDGQVTIDELLNAVNAALYGCL